MSKKAKIINKKKRRYRSMKRKYTREVGLKEECGGGGGEE
jgi:hypothetical protein